MIPVPPGAIAGSLDDLIFGEAAGAAIDNGAMGLLAAFLTNLFLTLFLAEHFINGRA